jgi:hypothetical protein
LFEGPNFELSHFFHLKERMGLSQEKQGRGIDEFAKWYDRVHRTFISKTGAGQRWPIGL